MAVYKEGWYAVRTISNRSFQIYPDAADFGAPFRKGDDIFREAATAAALYGIQPSRKVERYLTGKDASIDFELMDEFGPTPARRTKFRLTVVLPEKGIKTRGEKYDGYMHIEEVR